MSVVSESGEYQWEKLSDTAAFKRADKIQLMNIRDTIWAFLQHGIYYSTNGINFHLSKLEPIVSSTGLSGFIFFNNKLISLSHFKPHSLASSTGFTHTSLNLQDWKQVISSTMPFRRSYNPVGFKGKFWIFGGKDSSGLHADAWNSEDAIHWKKVADSLAFGPIDNYNMIVFKKKLLMLSEHLWDSEDGIHWRKVQTTAVPSLHSSTPIIFNDKLWIFGAGFINEENGKVLVSADLKKWDTLRAPWLERSSPAACIFHGKILLGGGNHHLISGNVLKDSLLNDIWQMKSKPDE